MKKSGLILGFAVAVLMLLLPAPRKTPRAITTGVTAPKMIRAEELSEWVIDGRQNYLLIDLRSKAAFQKNAIKTAVCVPASKLDAATIEALPAHRRIVVYSDDTEGSLPAWAAIRAYRDDVYVLDGGIKDWEEHILHPHPPSADAPESAWGQYNERLAIAGYYLGKSTGVAAEQPQRTIRLHARAVGVASDEGC